MAGKCHKVFKVWDADINEHVIQGTKIRVDVHVLISQQILNGQAYLQAQLEYFGGTTGPEVLHFQNSDKVLGPFVDKLKVSPSNRR